MANTPTKLIIMSPLTFVYTLLLILTTLEQPISAADQPPRYANKHKPSSIIFPVIGNVYPKGYVSFFNGFLFYICINTLMSL